MKQFTVSLNKEQVAELAKMYGFPIESNGDAKRAIIAILALPETKKTGNPNFEKKSKNSIDNS